MTSQSTVFEKEFNKKYIPNTVASKTKQFAQQQRWSLITTTTDKNLFSGRRPEFQCIIGIHLVSSPEKQQKPRQ